MITYHIAQMAERRAEHRKTEKLDKKFAPRKSQKLTLYLYFFLSVYNSQKGQTQWMAAEHYEV